MTSLTRKLFVLPVESVVLVLQVVEGHASARQLGRQSLVVGVGVLQVM